MAGYVTLHQQTEEKERLKGLYIHTENGSVSSEVKKVKRYSHTKHWISL
jgi:hypothetical protein